MPVEFDPTTTTFEPVTYETGKPRRPPEEAQMSTAEQAAADPPPPAERRQRADAPTEPQDVERESRQPLDSVLEAGSVVDNVV